MTFGTPIRYGWETAGYEKLLHFINHRPRADAPPHVTPFSLALHRMLAAVDGDYIQLLGIAGTNLPPLPLAVRTFLADWRLDGLLERNLQPPWLWQRLRHGRRVPDEGTTLLVDYNDPAITPLGHVFGHAPYTRSRWMPLHCELVARHFYGSEG